MTSADLEGQAAAYDRYRALLAVSEAIVSHRDLAALFHELAGRLHQVVHFDYLGLALHEATSNTMRIHLLEGSEPVPLPSPPVLPLEEAAPPTTARDVGVQARTLELLELRGLADEMVRLGNPGLAASFYGGGKRVFRLDFTRIDSRYHYLLFISQAETERILRTQPVKNYDLANRFLTQAAGT